MKNVTEIFSIFLFGVSNSVAQTPKQTPTAIASELSNLQADYDPASGKSPLVLLSVSKDGVAYYETKMRAKRLFEEKNCRKRREKNQLRKVSISPEK